MGLLSPLPSSSGTFLVLNEEQELWLPWQREMLSSRQGQYLARFAKNTP